MSRSWSTFLLWALFLAVLAAATAPFGPDVFTYALLGGSAIFIAVIGLVLLLLSRREGAAPGHRTRMLPDLSYPAMLLGLGIAALALGAELGFWLVMIGAGVCALAIGGLVREWRAQREAAEELPADG